MREIKFRIWRVDRKKMYEPWTIYEAERIDSDFNDYVFMQYTGLKDKNGKEIYEGDIVEIEIDQLFDSIEKVGIVEWSEGAACWSVDFPDEGVTLNKINPNVDTFEVIGNIYENPELLEEGE